jgi:LysM repeat protein
VEIWLSNGVSDKIQLPINPETIGYTDARNHQDIVTANGDEKTVLSGRSQRTYSISSFFPVQKPFYLSSSNMMTPLEYISKIKTWMDNQVVLQLQVTTTIINEPVTIRSFQWSESGGIVGDYDFTLELKEYQPITVNIIAPTPPPPPPPPPTSSGGAQSGSGTSGYKLLSVGSTVTVKTTATNYATGEHIASFVLGSKYTIKQEKAWSKGTSARAYLLEPINSWVLEQDIVEASSGVSQIIPTTTTRAVTTPQQQTYTVVKGDSLWNISKKVYGTGSKYMTIYNANKSVIGPNPNIIQPGQRLVIP